MVRVMSWNIWRGGQGHGPNNINNVLKIITEVKPDVLVTIETYGAGPLIRESLGPEYEGHQITCDDGQTRDNLWIISRLPVIRSFPAPNSPLSDFHCGGLTLEDGATGRAFDIIAVWLQYAISVSETIANAIPYLGTPWEPGNRQIVESDETRLRQIQELLDTYLPEAGSDSPIPTVIAGDFNSLSHNDWSEACKLAPGHHGLALEWPVTAAMSEAGFTDLYRSLHPDPKREPGKTWNVLREMDAPYRIDYIFTRGNILAKSIFMIDRYDDCPGAPFCSDHAALVTEISV